MFKKILAVAAVTATAACLSVSAFATEDVVVTPVTPVTPATDAITVTPVETPTTAAQYTVMLYKGVADATDIAVGDIYYINQGSDLSALVTGMKVKATTADSVTTYLPVGNYTVRIGNSTGSVENISLVVTQEQQNPTTFKITGYVADTYATVTLGETTVNVGNDGSFTLADLVDGAYTLVVKAPGAYAKTLAATIEGADIAVSTSDAAIDLKYGDINDEGCTTFGGLSKLIAAYDATSNDDNYLLACDFDRNGTVGFSDLSKLIANYDKTTSQVYAE